jgi:hypothetical protein
MIAAGAVVTIIDELHRRPVEANPDASGLAPTPPGQANLSLVPATRDRYRDDGTGRRRAVKPNPALQLNETATTVATVVTGAAVLGAIIATLAKK